MNADSFETLFRSLVGSDPAPHQRACANALAGGRSVVLRAPTGSGKSEAIWIPFLLCRGEVLPSRMIHALPMRALANQLTGRMSVYASTVDRGMRVAAMHGKRPESVLFFADAIFATLDQVVTSYACAPLSLSVRHGNIPGGAVAGSLLVFDEVHTFEPRLGLQATLVLARRAVDFGIPVAILSATLPANFTQTLAEQLRAEMVEVQEDQIPIRRRRKVTASLEPTRLDASKVLDYATSHRKTLVVTNRVAQAIAIYEGVRGRFDGVTILAHSRFYDDDRARKEDRIIEHFGKNASPQPALLVATQVVEVGLDISCDLLLTELAPVDALIQRAGRCSRWGGTGHVVIFLELETPRPYDALIIEATRHALVERNLNGQALTWQLELDLVDNVLGPWFKGLADPQTSGQVLASLAEANFTGNPARAEKAVRETLSIEVAIHDDPGSLGAEVDELPRCRVHPSVLRHLLQERSARAWRVTMAPKSLDDYRPPPLVEPLRDKNKLVPGGFVVVHPDSASYDPEVGLRLGVPGSPAEPAPLRRREKARPAPESFEGWSDHARRVVQAFETLVLPREQVAFRLLVRALEIPEDQLLDWVRLVLILHDLGKLTVDWQRQLREGAQPQPEPTLLLARRGGEVRLNLPAHATVSAWVAAPLLRRVASPGRLETLAVPSLQAIAHHHSVRADQTPPFRMAPGSFQAVQAVVAELTAHSVTENDFNTCPPSSLASLNLGRSFLSRVPYTVYLILSRWLRLSDWMASGGGEDAVLRFEEWFRDT